MDRIVDLSASAAMASTLYWMARSRSSSPTPILTPSARWPDDAWPDAYTANASCVIHGCTSSGNHTGYALDALHFANLTAARQIISNYACGDAVGERARLVEGGVPVGDATQVRRGSRLRGRSAGALSAAAERAEDAAAERAEELLLAGLTEQQRADYAQHGYFDVRSMGRVFRIHRGRSANIAEVDARGCELRRYCVHPVELVPDADTMLAQVLMLRANPHGFLALANVHPPRGPGPAAERARDNVRAAQRAQSYGMIVGQP